MLILLGKANTPQVEGDYSGTVPLPVDMRVFARMAVHRQRIPRDFERRLIQFRWDPGLLIPYGQKSVPEQLRQECPSS